MWVKICGNTNLEDAKLAAQLGADAVGFIFADSRRRVTSTQVAAIVSALPDHVDRVGVFDSHDAGEIARTVSEAGLTTAQLHNGFDEQLLENLRSNLAPGIRIIQTLHWMITGNGEEAAQATRIQEQLHRIASLGAADRVLIDSSIAGLSGGTGFAFAWSHARQLFRDAPAGLSLILAGGLKPENVADAIELLQPWGVDVASGVESSVGRKDRDRISHFMQNARRR